jgi:NAD(P)-dependent dehydrogenase (short-subunit alcohol dehydrogenase family)
MEVLVTGGDTDLGRTIAESFRDAGHRVVIAGARRDELDVAAKELEVDTIVNVPAPRWDTGDPRTYSLADQATAWRNALDTTVLSAVLTVQILGDHLRSGGSIISVLPESPAEGGAESAIKAALSDWTAGQAAHFGIRGITANVVASGRRAEPGYDGLSRTPAPVADEITRLALFLTTPSARHITGQTLHVSHGALANFA